ncbi:MAG: DUF6677 family protein [Planctomycetota bacterium]
MTRKASETPTSFPLVVPLVGGVLAWAIPGAGHWFIGRKVRGIILFVTITALFWSGVAIGGVFTVDPREEVWWSRAQLCTGLSGVISYYRQEAYYPEADTRQSEAAIRAQLAADDLALVAPAATLAHVFSGVAGLLNLLCIMDVVLLGAMGVRGEPLPGEDRNRGTAP